RRFGLLARLPDQRPQRRERLLQPAIELLPQLRLDAAELGLAPLLLDIAQRALDGPQVARLLLQQRHPIGGRSDEFLALAPRFLAPRGLLGEVARRRRVGPLAGAIEALPQRLGNAGILLVERLPLVAQRLH